MTRICVSLLVEASDQVVAAMRKARAMGADLVEWRLDITRNPDVEAVVPHAPLPVVATVRSAEQGGHFRGSRNEQLDLLLRAAAAGSAYLDWECGPEAALPAELSGISEQVIASYHNFRETPAAVQLESVFEQMAATGAGVLKIVTRARKKEDNLALLGLIARGVRRRRKVVAFCLGPLGRISRVACPLLGGYFTYVALEPQVRAAPGQLTLEEMHQILEFLK